MQTPPLAPRDRRLRDEAAVEVLAAVRRDGDAAPEELKPAFVYLELEGHLCDPGFSTEDLKRACPLGASRFHKLFRQAVERTPGLYVRDCRIEVAKRLLAGWKLPVETVGRLVGYRTPSGFRRGFKDRTGLSPAAWCKALASSPPELPELEEAERAVAWRDVLAGTAGPGLEAEVQRELLRLYPGLDEQLRRLCDLPPDAGNDDRPRDGDPADVVYERFKAERVAAGLDGEPFPEQEARVRFPVPFESHALFELLTQMGREQQDEDLERALELQRLALASLEACDPEMADDLPNRRTQGWTRIAAMLLAHLDEAEKALRFAEAEWDSPRPCRDAAAEAELLLTRARVKQHVFRQDVERAGEIYRHLVDEAGVESCALFGAAHQETTG